jgi:hypothetical protein
MKKALKWSNRVRANSKCTTLKHEHGLDNPIPEQLANHCGVTPLQSGQCPIQVHVGAGITVTVSASGDATIIKVNHNPMDDLHPRSPVRPIAPPIIETGATNPPNVDLHARPGDWSAHKVKEKIIDWTSVVLLALTAAGLLALELAGVCKVIKIARSEMAFSARHETRGLMVTDQGAANDRTSVLTGIEHGPIDQEPITNTLYKKVERTSSDEADRVTGLPRQIQQRVPNQISDLKSEQRMGKPQDAYLEDCEDFEIQTSRDQVQN